jgi:hypothetical protein
MIQRRELPCWFGIVAHRAVRLGGEHDVSRRPLSALPTISSDSPRAVAIGGVDEVDAGIQRLVDDADRIVVVGLPMPPNIIAPRQ